jgi:hypothetical protein
MKLAIAIATVALMGSGRCCGNPLSCGLWNNTQSAIRLSQSAMYLLKYTPRRPKAKLFAGRKSSSGKKSDQYLCLSTYSSLDTNMGDSEKMPSWMTDDGGDDGNDEGSSAPSSSSYKSPAPAPAPADKQPDWMSNDQSVPVATAVANDPEMRKAAFTAAQDPSVRKAAAAVLANDPNTPSWMSQQNNDPVQSPNDAVDGGLGRPLLQSNGEPAQGHTGAGCFWPCLIYSIYFFIVCAIWTIFVFSILQSCPTEDMRTNRCICLAAQLVVAGFSYYDYKTDHKFNFKFIWTCLFGLASVMMSIITLLDGIPVATHSCRTVKVDPKMIPIGDAFLCLMWGLMFTILRKVPSS